jgi:hypothetical protein
MSHTALEIEASKEVALGVINVDVTGIVVANEPLQDEPMPSDFAHDVSRMIDFGSAFNEFFVFLLHAALERLFLGKGLLTRRPAHPSGHPMDDLSRSARLSGVFVEEAHGRRIVSSISEFAFGLGYWTAERFGGFNPLLDDDLGVCHGLLIGGSVGHAAGEFGDFDDKGFVGFAPVDDEFVAHVSRSPVGI